MNDVRFLARVISVFLIFGWACTCNAQKDVGEQCKVARTGSAGTCKIIDDCPKVIDEIVKQQLYPTPCGYIKHKQIVCCPNPATQATTTQAPLLTRISQKKCAEYHELLKERLSVSVGFDQAVVKEILRCEIATVPLVVGGEHAKPKEFPHMALIGFQGDKEIAWSCGGTLISENFVLTAAHCVYANSQLGYAKYVRLGELNLDDDRDDSQPIDVNVIEHIKHPEFKAPSKYNDIALLRLDRQVPFNKYVRPACLANSFQPHTANSLATGWGLTDYQGKPSKMLMKVVLELYSSQECNVTYISAISRQLKNGIIEKSQLCAGSHNYRRDTCQGDSGGPLQVYHPYQSCMYEVVGVTSFGKGCGNINTPGVYTRVYNYLDWIEGIVWPNQ